MSRAGVIHHLISCFFSRLVLSFTVISTFLGSLLANIGREKNTHTPNWQVCQSRRVLCVNNNYMTE